MRERETIETQVSTVVVVVGGSSDLLTAVGAASRKLPGAEVVQTDVPNAPTTVAAHWPFAIVVSDDVYDFDPHEFDALARDVAAVILVGQEGLPYTKQVAGLEQSLVAALRHRVS